MRKIREVLKEKNIGCGYLYFYIHLITEIACFYYLSKITNNSRFIWLIPFIYDGLAFVPQALLGYINDKYPRLKLGILGMILLILAFLTYIFGNCSIYLSLILICIGNALIHVNGAEVTLKNSDGKLSHSAIFVAGGSFGVISGKLLATTIVSPIIVVILIMTMLPFILLADEYNDNKISNCNKFNYINDKINVKLVILLAVLVVIIRGYMGYGIPTSWNKTVEQTIILFVTMGIGKALGGIFSDLFGIRKVAIMSTILAIPFLCFGNNFMIISLIGVMLFSMTMSITLAILVSALKNTPGLAFGLTTIGLFIGTAPIFFIEITSDMLNIAMIVMLSLMCTLILSKILKKGDEYG